MKHNGKRMKHKNTIVPITSAAPLADRARQMKPTSVASGMLYKRFNQELVSNSLSGTCCGGVGRIGSVGLYRMTGG
jgi:hypothetical protein